MTYDPPIYFTEDEVAAYRKGYDDAEGAAPRAERLDVERLAEALGIVFPDIGAVPFYGEQLAAEYASLSRPSRDDV